MQTTGTYGLKKPDGTDTVDISVLNGNMDTIDTQLKKNADDISSHLADKTAHGIGDRTQLKTTAKDTLVNAVNELFTSGTNGKNDIYNAISAKGTIPASKNFSDLVTAIGNINTGKKFALFTPQIYENSLKTFATNYGNQLCYFITIPRSAITLVPRLIYIRPLEGGYPTFGDLSSHGIFSSNNTIYNFQIYDTFFAFNIFCYDDNNYYFPVHQTGKYEVQIIE